MGKKLACYIQILCICLKVINRKEMEILEKVQKKIFKPPLWDPQAKKVLYSTFGNCVRWQSLI